MIDNTLFGTVAVRNKAKQQLKSLNKQMQRVLDSTLDKRKVKHKLDFKVNVTLTNKTEKQTAEIVYKLTNKLYNNFKEAAYTAPAPYIRFGSQYSPGQIAKYAKIETHSNYGQVFVDAGPAKFNELALMIEFGTPTFPAYPMMRVAISKVKYWKNFKS